MSHAFRVVLAHAPVWFHGGLSVELTRRRLIVENGMLNSTVERPGALKTRAGAGL